MQLNLSFRLWIFLLVLIGLSALNQKIIVNQQSTDMTSNWFPCIRIIEELNTNTSDFRIAELQHINADKESDMKKYEADLATLTATIVNTILFKLNLRV